MGVRVEGLDELIVDAREAVARVEEPRPALDEWATQLDELVEDAFASQATPEGEAWAPRRTTTRSRVGGLERPRRRERGRRLGEDTGAMRASVEVQVAPRAVVLEVAAPHAAFFVAGTKHQPARPFVPTSDRGESAAVLDELVDGLAEHVVEAFRG